MRSKVRFSPPPSAFVTLSVVEFSKAASSLDVRDFALLRELTQAAGQLLDHAFLERAQAREVDLRFAEFDAPILGVARLFDQFGNVQQRFRGNASAIKAHAARIHLAGRSA